MSLAALDVKAVGTASFGLTNYNKLKANSDYLVVPGANLASAATLTPTSEFHVVTGAVTVDNLSPAGPVAGQQVRLLFQSALTIRNNGGGTGNIRTRTATDKQVGAGEFVTFTYDGTNWQVGDLRAPFRTSGVYDLNTSTTESSLISGAAASASTGWQLPANFLGVLGAVKVRVFCTYLKNDSAGSTGILKITLGNTAIYTMPATALSAQSATRSVFWIDFFIWNNGATNAQVVEGRLYAGSPSVATVGLQGGGLDVNFEGTGTLDTTVAQYLDVRWQHSVSSALLSIQRVGAFGEVV